MNGPIFIKRDVLRILQIHIKTRHFRVADVGEEDVVIVLSGVEGDQAHDVAVYFVGFRGVGSAVDEELRGSCAYASLLGNERDPVIAVMLFIFCVHAVLDWLTGVCKVNIDRGFATSLQIAALAGRSRVGGVYRSVVVIGAESRINRAGNGAAAGGGSQEDGLIAIFIVSVVGFFHDILIQVICVAGLECASHRESAVCAGFIRLVWTRRYWGPGLGFHLEGHGAIGIGIVVAVEAHGEGDAPAVIVGNKCGVEMGTGKILCQCNALPVGGDAGNIVLRFLSVRIGESKAEIVGAVHIIIAAHPENIGRIVLGIPFRSSMIGCPCRIACARCAGYI